MPIHHPRARLLALAWALAPLLALAAGCAPLIGVTPPPPPLPRAYPPSAAQPLPASGAMVRSRVASLNLRQCPGRQCRIIGVLHPGQELGLIGQEGGWAQVRTSDGRQGWVAARYLGPADQAAPAGAATPGAQAPAGPPAPREEFAQPSAPPQPREEFAR